MRSVVDGIGGRRTASKLFALRHGQATGQCRPKPEQRRSKPKYRLLGRGKSGSTLTEVAPALILLLLIMLFPIIDLIFLAVSYFSCYTLNDLQLREAAKIPRSQATSNKGAVMVSIPNDWRTNAVGVLSGVFDQPSTDVDYRVGKHSIYVVVQTTVVVKPLLTIPIFPGVPGLGAPITYTIQRERLLENMRFMAE